MPIDMKFNVDPGEELSRAKFQIAGELGLVVEGRGPLVARAVVAILEAFAPEIRDEAARSEAEGRPVPIQPVIDVGRGPTLAG